jgi:hypothetical protein
LNDQRQDNLIHSARSNAKLQERPTL